MASEPKSLNNHPMPGQVVESRILLGLPFVLLISMALVFTLAGRILGKEAGYLLGFVVYWLVWCLLAPWLVLGRRHFSNLLRDRQALWTRNNWLAALLWLVVTGVALLMYGKEFLAVPFSLILLAIPLATINGLCEETLWRGLYVHVFPGNPWLGMIYPAFGFAIWHLAPQILSPAENVFVFELSTLFLGLAYGWIAYRTGSAKWTAISHSLNGILALAAPMSQALLTLWVQ